jgi:disulfide bond formation protein DsbB
MIENSARATSAPQRNTMVALLSQYGSYLTFTVATVATLGSLYFSEAMNFIPCELCWYQRIFMYPLVLISLVGIIKKDEYLPNYVLPFSVIGLGMSFYHYGLQWGLWGDPTACAGGVACSARYINYGGFITIPFLALTAFTLITIVMGATYWANRKLEADA